MAVRGGGEGYQGGGDGPAYCEGAGDGQRDEGCPRAAEAGWASAACGVLSQALEPLPCRFQTGSGPGPLKRHRLSQFPF